MKKLFLGIDLERYGRDEETGKPFLDATIHVMSAHTCADQTEDLDAPTVEEWKTVAAVVATALRSAGYVVDVDAIVTVTRGEKIRNLPPVLV